jgi:hypothetical protein
VGGRGGGVRGEGGEGDRDEGGEAHPSRMHDPARLL